MFSIILCLAHLIGIGASSKYNLLKESKILGKELSTSEVRDVVECAILCDGIKCCKIFSLDTITASQKLLCGLYDLTYNGNKNSYAIANENPFPRFYQAKEVMRSASTPWKSPEIEIDMIGKPCEQLSKSGAGLYTCNFGIDGETHGLGCDRCVGTGGVDMNPWWYVDLGVHRTITRVVIYNRSDGWIGLLDDITIQVQDQPMPDQSCAQTCVSGFRYTTELIRDFTCPQPIVGRYLVVWRAGVNILSFVEVKAYGY